MGSLFKKPSWAAKTAETNDQFYRRAEHTYSDIVAANKAHKKSRATPEKAEAHMKSEETNSDTRESKRSRLSDQSSKEETTESTSTKVPEVSSPAVENEPLQPPLFDATACANPAVLTKPQLPGSSTPSDARKIDDTQSLPRETSSASLFKTPDPPAPVVEDPAVQIFITSDIPNVRPLIVHRKMSQGLREVRLEWCRRQGFTAETQSAIYLTWQGRRLFDVTTCRSLGVKPTEPISILSMDDDFEPDQKKLQIHMVAVTEDPLILNRPAPPEPDELTQKPQKPEVEQTEDNEPMKLTLRSPGLNDLRIKARPKTMVSKLISVFRSKQNISADQEIFIVFDGDRLDPNTCLQDHDIDDLDLLDIQIKP
ncbi:Ubiquitin supergroup [Penicillium malachiteum]|uniref:Ubiquitin supergroup n=1 Tax=Penicillium malachiteum TaxID=1324776 RepID=A0AAD6MS82_9EURO|nr:Ubiquitin supergroup [Penicillium malachiteum]